MSSRKNELVAGPAAINWKTSMANTMNHARDAKSAFLFMQNFHFIDSTCTSDNTILVFISKWENSLPKTTRIHIRYFLFVSCRAPVNSLLQSKFVEIPNLKLVLCSITPNKQLSIMIINWVSCYVQAKNWFDWFSLSNIPEVENWIPTPWYDCIIINELDGKYSIWVSSIIPLCAAKICADTFGV